MSEPAIKNLFPAKYIMISNTFLGSSNPGFVRSRILYDTDMDKAKDAIFRYLDKFQPDALFGHSYVNIGQGPLMELGAPTGRNKDQL